MMQSKTVRRVISTHEQPSILSEGRIYAFSFFCSSHVTQLADAWVGCELDKIQKAEPGSPAK